MAISRRLLGDDERVITSTRTHVKALLGPALLLILIAAVAGFLTSLPSGEARDVLQLIIGVVALAVIAVVVGRPFVTWLGTTYTITDRRIITRSGFLSRRGHDIPMHQVSDVAYERGLVDRVLGCGTLVVSVANEYGWVRLHDIPHVEQVHLRISEELYDGRGDSAPDDEDVVATRRLRHRNHGDA